MYVVDILISFSYFANLTKNKCNQYDTNNASSCRTIRTVPVPQSCSGILIAQVRSCQINLTTVGTISPTLRIAETFFLFSSERLFVLRELCCHQESCCKRRSPITPPSPIHYPRKPGFSVSSNQGAILSSCECRYKNVSSPLVLTVISDLAIWVRCYLNCGDLFDWTRGWESPIFRNAICEYWYHVTKVIKFYFLIFNTWNFSNYNKSENLPVPLSIGNTDFFNMYKFLFASSQWISPSRR